MKMDMISLMKQNELLKTMFSHQSNHTNFSASVNSKQQCWLYGCLVLALRNAGNKSGICHTIS